MIVSTRIAHENINLPTPPTQSTRDALELAAKTTTATRQGRRERDKAVRELDRAKRAWPRQQARAIADGVDLEGANPIPAAEAAAVAAQERLEAHVAAESMIAVRLRNAVTDDQDAWSASAAADAQTALSELATAIQMAEEAHTALYAHLGVLGMYARMDDGRGRLSVWHGPEASHFDIEKGIKKLRNGLNTATGELDRLRPRKPRKAKSDDGAGAS